MRKLIGDKTIIDTCAMNNKKTPPKRKYHDGDIVEFDFEPNSIDVRWQKITLIGVVSGVLYEKEGIIYKIQLRDNKRNIFGDVIVPEGQINGKIEHGTITVECDFCKRKIHVDQNNPEDVDRKTSGWRKYYCLGRKHHVLNMCSECVNNAKIDKELKCPHDHCASISEKERERLKECGIKLKDEI